MSLTDNLLEVNNLYKSYYTLKDELKVLDNISFKVYENDFIGIIGPSGCGKSSILNILAKLDNEFNGDLKYRDNIKIGYMLQEDALFDWLNIYENAIIGLKIKKILNKENVRYVNNLLMKYNLYEFKNKYPCELSGGMKQRLALIRTLAIKPDILLLDEPFSRLDLITRLEISDDVYNIIKKEKKTTIIISHDIAECISLCDRVAIMSRRPGTIKNIYNIDLINKTLPSNNRNDEKFYYYYDVLWKEIDK